MQLLWIRCYEMTLLPTVVAFENENEKQTQTIRRMFGQRSKFPVGRQKHKLVAFIFVKLICESGYHFLFTSVFCWCRNCSFATKCIESEKINEVIIRWIRKWTLMRNINHGIQLASNLNQFQGWEGKTSHELSHSFLASWKKIIRKRERKKERKKKRKSETSIQTTWN